MSKLSDYLRRRRIDPVHDTRRRLARYIDKRGFEVGDYSYGAPEIMPWGDARLIVGRYCSIGPRVRIYLGGNHRVDWASTYPFRSSPGFPEAWSLAQNPETSRGDVMIGSDVWIGAGATILSGVNIGHGAVIGAEAVVSRDVPPFAIMAGNPARLVRHRFPDAIVAGLLETAWWEFDRPAVVDLLPLLSSDQVEALIVECRRRRAGGA